MSDKKSFFRRAYGAVIESRMRTAERELAQYRSVYDLEAPRKAR